MTAEKEVVMGKALGAHGIRGYVKIQPFTVDPATLLTHRHWHFRREPGAEIKTLTLRDGRQQNGQLIVSFEKIETRDDAQALRGMLVAVPRDSLPKPKPGEFYFTDLVGLTVVNREAMTLGQVNAVQDYGAQPILHITPADAQQKAEILIPFVDSFIDDVLPDEGVIRVDFQAEWL
jgi:16S rRNA processing protein RimM